MIKVEASTLEEAYKEASSSLNCSVTELIIEVVQNPTSGFLGLFKKSAIIVATIDRDKVKVVVQKEETIVEETLQEVKALKESVPSQKSVLAKKREEKPRAKKAKKTKVVKEEIKEKSHTVLNDTIMPASFVSDQDDDAYDDLNAMDYTADYDDEFDNTDENSKQIDQMASEIEGEINNLFDLTCFKIDKIEVKAHDENTILIEFKGEDAALLIGKEGYRYKALSYMIFNWINTKYDVQLRLEIAEFLKNQEESVSRYLVGVCENVARDGRAQTKILDGVLVQIALRELRDKYPDKYVVIRSTRDGLKYIIVNDYHSN